MYRVEDKYLCNEEQMFLLQSRLDCILQKDINQGSRKSVSGDECLL